jgi:hypothetical protein
MSIEAKCNFWDLTLHESENISNSQTPPLGRYNATKTPDAMLLIPYTPAIHQIYPQNRFYSSTSSAPEPTISAMPLMTGRAGAIIWEVSLTTFLKPWTKP